MPFDRTNTTHLVSLQNEVNNDPELVGYAAVVSETAKLLDLLNLEANNPQVNDTVNVPFDEFPLYDGMDEIHKPEYNALNGFDKDIIYGMMCAAMQDPTLTFGHAKKLFRKAFGTESTTWANVKDDRAVHASRAEVLFGRDTVLTREDWFAARDYVAA